MCALHALLAGVLLATHLGPSLPGYLTPAQAFAALLIVDVCAPAAFAWWRKQQAQAAGDQSPDSTTTTASQQQAYAMPSGAGQPAGVRRRSSAMRAAEPSSPAPALFSAHEQQAHSSVPQHSQDSDAAEDELYTAAADAHLLQPSTPPGVKDGTSSPSRQHSASSALSAAAMSLTEPAAAAARHAAAVAAGQAGSSADIRPVADQGAQQDHKPQLSFEDALAACARGVAARQAAGSTTATMLYQSQLHHHVVSIKVGAVDQRFLWGTS